MIRTHLVEIIEASQVGEARRLGQRMATSCGFDEVDEGRIGLIITEAATNIVRYGNGGSIILQALCNQNQMNGVEILALDRGPGMRDISSCLVDGYSTGGTQGSGLGAIRRLSDFFDIYSAPGHGTAILSRVYPRKMQAVPRENPEKSFVWGAVSLNYPGEEVCGDSWAAEVDGDRGVFMVVDGLGHGLGAADAAWEAVAVFRQDFKLPPASLLQYCDNALRKTRGAAAAIASIDLQLSTVQYAGIGNITGSLTAPGSSQHMVSHPGILGNSVRKFQEFSYTWSPGTVLIMFSDGLSSRCDLSATPGLSAHDPTLIAGVLLRDFQRGRDDATILVVKALHHHSG